MERSQKFTVKRRPETTCRQDAGSRLDHKWMANRLRFHARCKVGRRALGRSSAVANGPEHECSYHAYWLPRLALPSGSSDFLWQRLVSEVKAEARPDDLHKTRKTWPVHVYKVGASGIVQLELAAFSGSRLRWPGGHGACRRQREHGSELSAGKANRGPS